MVSLGQNPDVSDDDAISWFNFNKFDITKGASVEVLVSRNDMKEIFDILEDIETPTADSAEVFMEGDLVTVTTKDGIIEGTIKNIGYQIKGAGNKYYSKEEMNRG